MKKNSKTRVHCTTVEDRKKTPANKGYAKPKTIVKFVVELTRSIDSLVLASKRRCRGHSQYWPHVKYTFFSLLGSMSVIHLKNVFSIGIATNRNDMTPHTKSRGSMYRPSVRRRVMVTIVPMTSLCVHAMKLWKLNIGTEPKECRKTVTQT